MGCIIVQVIRIVVAYEIGPAEKACFPGLVELVVSAGAAAVEAIVVCIGADLSPIQKSLFLVYGDTIGIPVAHDIYFGAGFFFAWGEGDSLGDIIRAGCLYFVPEDLSPEVVGITRAAAGNFALGARPGVVVGPTQPMRSC